MMYHYYVSYAIDKGGYGCAELVVPDQITNWNDIVSAQDKLVKNLHKDGLVGNQVIILYWTLLRTEES